MPLSACALMSEGKYLQRLSRSVSMLFPVNCVQFRESMSGKSNHLPSLPHLAFFCWIHRATCLALESLAKVL